MFKHEERFASHKYNSCFTLGDYSNTPLEGTNGGLKYCNFAVKPNMSMSKSASYMICQDENKYNEKIRVAYNNFSKTRLYGFKGESGRATRRIVPGALGELANQMELASSYCSLRTGQENWVVRVAREHDDDTSMELLPRFHRLRYVQRDELGAFCCTCPYTKMYGIPCRHMVHVIHSYCSEPYFFSHHDVDIRWWTMYATLVSLKDPDNLDDQERVMKSELIRIRLHEKLHIGKTVILEPFLNEVYVCGSQSSNGFKDLSLENAKTRLFVQSDRSYPVNYDQSLVETALSVAGGGYNGVKRYYSLSYSSQNHDDDDNDVNVHTNNDFTIDDMDGAFASRVVEMQDEMDYAFTSRVVEKPKVKIDHHQVMKSVYKSLWDAFENCTDEFFDEMKKECESASRAMLIRVQQHIILNSGNNIKQTNSNSGTLSCRPTNSINVGREHRKQNQW